MRQRRYLLDTHALIFWVEGEEISFEFIEFLDKQAKKGKILISSVSIWEIALLKKKGRVDIDDIHGWKDDIISHSQGRILDPTASDMIDSTLLPDHHRDPFDRLLIAQAVNSNSILVTRDRNISRYSLETFWM
ncbi:MAG: type II toxin-antitoxin system VapC family toxin [Candidatus Aminicenantes bacterium]|nr:MAG: type II toxin-antitoxin system VapC family toxin [Candidatus Aminicenantes bacterium]